ncbi:MAG TPA: hypothetical protein VF627_15150 [Abditibacterium sp.]|jgi:hypothetical protein
MNDPYHWIYEFADRAMEENRPDKLHLIEILAQSESLSNELPDARLALCEQGRALAQSLDEPWWSATFDYWKSEILLYYKHDPEAALAVAAKLLVEMRKPQFAAFPHRLGVHLNFIAAYSKIDPIGYAPQIRAALDEADWNPDDSSHGVYWQLRTRFLTAIGDAEAVEVAWGHFHFACEYHAKHDSGSSHYIIYALLDLLIALHRFEPEAARAQTAELAEWGEELSRHDRNERLSAIFTMWRAVGARFSGDEPSAARFYRLAMKKQTALSPPRSAVFPAALAFHLDGDEMEKALQICDATAEIAQQHGHWFEMATHLAKKCEILRLVARDFAAEAIELRQVAAKLPSKAHWEAQLSHWEQEL